MTTIIFAVEKPDTEASFQNEQKWRGVTSNLSALTKKNKDIQQLGENVLLISLENNLDGLSKVIQEIYDLPYMYLVSTEELTWTKVTKTNS